MSRCDGSRLVTSRPSTRTWPAVGCSSPATRRSSVDLPQPEAPTMTSISPSARARSMPCSTSIRPKLLRSPCSSSVAMMATLPSWRSRRQSPFGYGVSVVVRSPEDLITHVAVTAVIIIIVVAYCHKVLRGEAGHVGEGDRGVVGQRDGGGPVHHLLGLE